MSVFIGSVELDSKYTSKKLNLEIIRIIAIAFVIFNHTGIDGFQAYSTMNNGVLYWVYLFLAVLCKVAVPLFFMVSGALLLEKDYSIVDIYKKRILRIAIVLILFSFFQYCRLVSHGKAPLQFIYFLQHIYSDQIILPYWYLYQYISFLITLPFLRGMVKNLRTVNYIYLILIWVMLVMVNSIIAFFSGQYLNANLSCVLLNTSIFYPVMGYFIEKVFNSSKYNNHILVLGGVTSMLCIMLSSIFTWWEVLKTGDSMTQRWLGTFSAIPAFYIFYLVKYICGKVQFSIFLNKLIYVVGNCTFGIYLIEGQLRSIFFPRFIAVLAPFIPSLPSCLIGIPIVIVIGTVIIWAIKKLPIINRLI